jgi:hypothetical protein
MTKAIGFFDFKYSKLEFEGETLPINLYSKCVNKSNLKQAISIFCQG